MSKEVQVVTGRMKMISNDQTKRNIVRESYESGLSLNQFAKDRGISPASLCQWRKKFPIDLNRSDDLDDVETLRTENEALKKELFKIKAYLGHKIFEFEGLQIA